MHKNFIYISLVLLAFVSIAATQVNQECDAKALKTELKAKLKPEYRYDSAKTSRFMYQNKKQIKELEVPLYANEKYRFVFNAAGIPKDIKIEIYNRRIGDSKRKLMYQVDQKDGEHIYTFDPKKSRKMYITYTIPAVKEKDLRGCVVFLLGFRNKLFK